jgi:hypothetical protein
MVFVDAAIMKHQTINHELKPCYGTQEWVKVIADLTFIVWQLVRYSTKKDCKQNIDSKDVVKNVGKKVV